MKQQIFNLQRHVNFVKLDFSVYISNEQIPLEERWECFCKAPSYLKEECEPCIFDYQDKYPGLVGYDCLIHVERYRVIDVAEQVTYLEELIQDYTQDPDEHCETYKQLKSMFDCGYSLRELKEHILKHNAGYFTYDW